MPEICRFYGMVIRIYLIDREHPPKHMHVKYGEHEGVDELIEMGKTPNFHPIQPLE